MIKNLKKTATKNGFKQGFTLIEFTIVVGLMGFLAIIATQEIARLAVGKRFERTVWQVKLITEALEKYHTNNFGFTGLMDLNTLCSPAPGGLVPYICNEDSPLATYPNPYVLTEIMQDSATLQIPVAEYGHAVRLQQEIARESFGSVLAIEIIPGVPNLVLVRYDLMIGDPPEMP